MLKDLSRHRSTLGGFVVKGGTYRAYVSRKQKLIFFVNRQVRISTFLRNDADKNPTSDGFTEATIGLGLYDYGQGQVSRGVFHVNFDGPAGQELHDDDPEEA